MHKKVKKIISNIPQPVIQTGSFAFHFFRTGKFHPVIFSKTLNPQQKHQLISEISKKCNITILVETGTFRGDTIFANLNNFKKIYSIEIQKDFYNNAKERFKNYPHVKILEGDSATVLPNILPQLQEPALFWLDGHYDYNDTSGRGDKDTPIIMELMYIFSSRIKGHIILIDDARYFIDKNGYPTIGQLKKFVKIINPAYVVEVNKGIILIYDKTTINLGKFE